MTAYSMVCFELLSLEQWLSIVDDEGFDPSVGSAFELIEQVLELLGKLDEAVKTR
jgi:hypothetical protein